MDILEHLQELTVNASSTEQEKLKTKLSTYLNHLVLTDFNSLVQLLYRMDVSEDKLKKALACVKEKDAGDVLADMIINRYLEKLAAKKSKLYTGPIKEDEKW